MLEKIFKGNVENISHDPISISIEEKKFYLNLYNMLPVDYSLAFHSDIINLNALLIKDKSNFSKTCLFLEKFNNQTVDFIVLDYRLQASAIILFDHPKGSKTHTEFYKNLVDLNVPVFVYTKQNQYKCEDLLMYLNSSRNT